MSAQKKKYFPASFVASCATKLWTVESELKSYVQLSNNTLKRRKAALLFSFFLPGSWDAAVMAGARSSRLGGDVGNGGQTSNSNNLKGAWGPDTVQCPLSDSYQREKKSPSFGITITLGFHHSQWHLIPADVSST